MAKLYPPNIQGVIPAFYTDNNEGTTIVVPFSMNKAVGEKEINGFEIKIKTISGIVKLTQQVYINKPSNLTEDECNGKIDFQDGKVTFYILPNDVKFQVGQFYKIQIAYINKIDGVPGYYSTVGVAKCTTKPQVYIEGLEADTSNTHIYNYVGVYSQESLAGEPKKDASEKLYSSKFTVWDESGNVYKESGDVVHNTTADVNSYEASEQFSFLEDLEEEKIFTIQFEITTVNLLNIKTPKYRIKQRKSIESEQKVFIYAENDFVNAGISLTLEGNGQETLSGSFIISRADSRNDFLDWQKMFDFTLENAIDPKKWSAKDFSTEQGVYYKYSIQQYNQNGVFSEKTYSDVVYSDFEDAFLYDGNKLLNIRFNPKVSSFKINLSENKQDTIGSQFPYFFRNGHVKYKEFPISGLISYMSDVDNLFNDCFHPNTINLTGDNIAAEREFKIDVLNWLTNGQPKLFKSPGEGNYIVRLMNTSLSPIDSVNRMLHSFSCTAYELMECNGENLFNCGLIGKYTSPDPIRTIKTISLSDIKFDPERAFGHGYYEDLITTGLKTISFINLMPGTIVKIDDNEFCIGSTGSLYYDAGEDSPIKKVSIWVDEDAKMEGSLSYTYSKIDAGVFDIVAKTKSQEVPLIQFFGNYYNQETLIDENGKYITSNNIFDFLQDVRTTILKIYMIRLQKRDEEEIYIKKEDYENVFIEKTLGRSSLKVDLKQVPFYKDPYCKQLIIKNHLTANKYYPIRIAYTKDDLKQDFNYEGYYSERLDGNIICPYTDWAIDGLSLDYFKLEDSAYEAQVDNNKINVAEKNTYIVPEPETYTYLSIGKCVTAELSFAKMTTFYTLEDTILELAQLRDEYNMLLENALSLDSDYKYYLEVKIEDNIRNYYLEYMNQTGNNGGKIESSEALRIAYYNYVSRLAKELKEYKERMAVL